MMYTIEQTRYWIDRGPETTTVEDGQGNPLEFESEKAATDWISESDSRVYHESNGETGRPTYSVE